VAGALGALAALTLLTRVVGVGVASAGDDVLDADVPHVDHRRT